MAAQPTMTSRPRWLGLDGLRGLAVLAVVGFHAEVPGFSGGFLGVSLFFVLSGFLLTVLLVDEHRGSGTISLGRFWAARVRRILPALIATLAGVVVFALVAADAGQQAALAGAIPAAIGQVSNWWLIAESGDYLDLFAAASPLQHLWSLAIEIQLYLLLPIVAAVALDRDEESAGRLAGIALGVAGASFVWFIVRSAGDDGLLRGYYGTDTRAFEFALGVGAAALWADRRGSDRSHAIARVPDSSDHVLVAASDVDASAGVPARPVADRRGETAQWQTVSGFVTGAGVLGIAGLLVATVATDLGDTWWRQGGLGAIALASVAATLAATEPGPVGRALSWAPLVVLGRVSYVLYLVHWPVFVWLDAARTGFDGTALFALRMGVTAVATLGVHRLVAEPARLRTTFTRPRSWIAAPAALATVLAAGLLATSQARQPSITFAAADAPTTAGDAVVAGTSVDRPHVLVAGDSLAANLASALGRWAEDSGDALVTNMAVPGCGIARGGEVRVAGELRSSAPVCEDWTDRWAATIAATEPDIVVIHSATWDLLPRRLDQWDEHRTIGDPVFDFWLLSEYEQALETLAASGAQVVWLTPPCVEIADADLATPPGAIEALDALINDAFGDGTRAAVSVVDLASRVCPGGNFGDTIEGVADGRPDGVHFSDRAADELARWLGPAILDSGS